MAVIETEVVVVGAGPVGLALALELASQGRRCVVLEQGDRANLAPRAKTTNVRTRELLRRWGIAGRLAALAPFGVEHPSRVVFATRMAGPELTRFENAFYCSTERDDRYSEHAQWVPQYRVEEVLRGRALELGAQIRQGVRLDGFAQDAEGVDVQATEAATGAPLRLRCRYLVGADGARSTVRERLGIRMEGTSLTQHHNIIFRAPGLTAALPHPPGVMYWLVNSEVPCVVAPLERGDVWTFGCPRLGEDDDPEPMIRAALRMDLPIEILQRDVWKAHQLVATRYRDGRVFLAGDACHLHPPFGGHGMNMGVGDAVDLGWKLAATLAGWGGPALLDGYEAERRPVHRRVVQEAVDNLSYNSGTLAREGLEDEGPRGEAVRADVAATIRTTKRQEFDSLGIVLGARYDGSPLVAAEPGEPEPYSGALPYVPSARPGGLAPHAWLQAGTQAGASLYDHFAPDALTLLVTRPQALASASLVEAAARELRIPLRVAAPPHPPLGALYGADYALVRPDHFVAWRGDRAEAACAALAMAAGRA